jgi:hypothetical protein
MIKTLSNILTISGLTAMEQDSYFEKFGENGWLDVEQKILIDVKSLNEYEISKYDMFFGISIVDYEWVVVNLG